MRSVCKAWYGMGWRATKQNMEVRLVVVGASKSRPAIHLNTTTLPSFLSSRIECCCCYFLSMKKPKFSHEKKYMILLSLDYNIYFFLRGVHAKCIDSSPRHSTCGHFFLREKTTASRACALRTEQLEEEKGKMTWARGKRNHLLGDQEAQALNCRN